MYKFESKNRSHFSLSEDNEQILDLKYPNWYSREASVRYLGRLIEIKPKNILGMTYLIYDDGIEIGDIIFNWAGLITIRVLNEVDRECRFIFKSKGFWKNRLQLFTENNVFVLSMKPIRNWMMSNHSYEIEVDEDQRIELDFDMDELMIYCGYTANIYMMKQGG